jgi:hypothetical protein
MATREKQEKLVDVLKAWQHIERRSVAQAKDIIERSRNPAIRLVMEIIQRDSTLHERVQQFIIDSIEKEAVTLTVEDLAQVWTAIEAHIEAERKTGELISAAKDALHGSKDVVQRLLLSYLGTDERKHDQLLDDLELVKVGMYRSA